MAATRVALIPERFGQLLRRGLQQRLGAGAGGALPAARWELQVAPVLAAEATGIQRDGSATRVRYVATANWTLLRLTPREPAANGFERTTDAYNVQPNQFFAADIGREAAERRMAEVLADEVVLRLAVSLRNLRAGEGAPLIAPVAPPPILPEPAPPPQAGGLPGLESAPGMGGGLGGGLGPLGMPR
jgi:LPS-assembly lipoprotein